MKKQAYLAALIGVGLGLAVAFHGSALAGRNPGGTYSSPSADFISGTVINSNVMNAKLADLGTEITDSLSRSGKGGMLARLRGVDGTSALPAYAFTAETTLGLWRAGNGDLRASSNGTDIQKWSSTELRVYQAATFEKGVVVTTSTTNGVGITTTGNGTAAGLQATGGASGGTGIVAAGNGTGGFGLVATGGAGTSGGVFTGGTGTAGGLTATGTGAGVGVTGTGGPTAGFGVVGVGGSGGSGVVGVGTGTGGFGVVGTGGTNTSGANFQGGTGTADGLQSTGSGTGSGVVGMGGASNGVGVRGVGTAAGAGVSGAGGATNGVGVSGAGAGSGAGGSFTGGPSGSGVVGTGGPVAGGNPGGPGVTAVATGINYGLAATGSSSGAGVLAVSGIAATSGVPQSAIELGGGYLEFLSVGGGMAVPAASTAIKNTLTPVNFPKTLAKVGVSGGTATLEPGGFNITSASRSGTDLLLTWAAPFTTDDYVCQVTINRGGVIPAVTGQTTTAMTVGIRSTTVDAAVDLASNDAVFHVTCAGPQ